MSANDGLFTVKTYVRHANTPVFHIWTKMLNFVFLFGYLRGPEGLFNEQTGPILLPSYPAPIYMYMYM